MTSADILQTKRAAGFFSIDTARNLGSACVDESYEGWKMGDEI